MKCATMLGDYLSEAQLRTLVRDYQVEQKYGSMGSPAHKRRKSELLGVAGVRARVQNYRHKRQRGELPKRAYISQEDAIARYERAWERMESCEEIFAICQGQSTRKHSDIRANAIKGGRRHGGRVVHRPTIKEKSGVPTRVARRSENRVMVGYRV